MMERESQGFATTLWGRIKTRVTQSGTDVLSGKATCAGPHRLDLVTEEGPFVQVHVWISRHLGLTELVTPVLRQRGPEQLVSLDCPHRFLTRVSWCAPEMCQVSIGK